MKRVCTANSMMVTPWICLNLRAVIVQQASRSRETEKLSNKLEKWVESILPHVAKYGVQENSSTKFEFRNTEITLTDSDGIPWRHHCHIDNL